MQNIYKEKANQEYTLNPTIKYNKKFFSRESWVQSIFKVPQEIYTFI